MAGLLLTDLKLANLDKLVKAVKHENDRQLDKWGVQTRSPAEWHLYLSEEVGELAEAIAEHYYREGHAIEAVHEAIQVATLALKIAEMYGELYTDTMREVMGDITDEAMRERMAHANFAHDQMLMAQMCFNEKDARTWFEREQLAIQGKWERPTRKVI